MEDKLTGIIYSTDLTNVQGEYLASSLERELWALYPDKNDFYVSSISYFNWDHSPAYFVMLIADDASKRYLEIVVSEADDGNGIGPYPVKWDFATHGYPFMSKEVWAYKE
jgi:hypothetical protein